MATFPALDEVEGKLDHRRGVLGQIFDEARGGEAEGAMDLTRVKCIPGDTAAKTAKIRALNDELTDLAKQREDLLAVKRAEEGVRYAGKDNTGTGGDTGGGTGLPGSEPDDTKGRGASAGEGQRAETVGELFTKSRAYKDRAGSVGPEAHLDIEVKTLMTTGAGFAPETTRTGRIVPMATRPIQVTDLVPQGQTTQAAVVYMEETTFTNAAAEVAEGGTYPEAALGLTEQSSTVRKISVYLPVTDEQLEDEPQVRGYINNRLPFMVRQRLDGQVLNGSGTAPNLRGFLNVVGIQTQAKGTDPVPDAIYRAMVKVRTVGRAIPDSVVINPLDWQDIRLLRTTDGLYIWGNPSDAGPERIWGLNIAQSDAIAENTALVGDLGNYTELVIRRGIDVQVSNSHGTYFIEGKQAMRADMRAALVVYRPAALCTVTGI